MASDPQGSTINLSDSRAEALQALVSSLAPGGASSADTLSKEDVTELSEKLKELLGGVELPQGVVQGNGQQDEPLNEEGLPIIEITEPMESVSQSTPGAPAGTAPIVPAGDDDDASFVPMYRLPPSERARDKAQMDRILDLLEAEELIETERTDARDRQQLEQRRVHAKAELERIRALKDMQKKMGKALLRNMADARAKDEQASAQQMRADMEIEEARKARKPRKCVSWAELPKSEKVPPPPSEAAALPMRADVVERFPTAARPISSPSPPPPPADTDSDDESDPPSPHHRVRSPGPEPPLSDDTDDGDEEEEEEEDEHHASDDNEFDIDAVQHQREIALAYFEKRNKIGADAARAMSAAHEWDQEDVPLNATLAGRPPKPPHSKFKSERLTAPSTSLGTSMLPSTSSTTLLRSVRTGKLDNDQLIGSESDNDNDNDDMRTFVDALRRGEVTNAGAGAASENSDALVAALESAYGAPQKPAAAVATTAPPRTLAVDDEGPREGAAVTAMRETVLERKRPTTQSQPPPLLDTPMAIVDSPSFPPPPVAVIDSPPSVSRRPTRPPTVLPASSLVRESQQQQQQQQQHRADVPVPGPGPGKKMSRFKAQQQTATG